MTNTFEGNSLIHIPVTNSLEDINTEYPPSAAILGKGKQCSWWSDNPLLSYKAMLVSAYYGMDKIEDRSQIRDDVLFLGDSGGFQILQNKLDPTKCNGVSKKLTPEKVIKWQMKVCDIGMTLDIPTPRTWDQVKNRKIFEDRLKESKKNALAMLEYKTKHIEEAYNPDFKLFNCIQGAFYEDMERWYDVTTNHHDYEYDGFSLPNSEMKYILPLRLGFAIEHSKGKPFHLLGLSSPNLLPLVAYANKYTKTQIYFDSSSTSFGKRIRKYMSIFNFGGNGFSLKETPIYSNFKGFSCDCPVCKQLEKPDDLWKLGTTSGTLISLHNLFWMTTYTEFINNFVNCEEEFIEYTRRLTPEPYNPHISWEIPLKSNGLSWHLRYIEFLDYVHENGLETAWNKYFKRNESSDSSILDESNTESCDPLMLNPDYNSKIRKLQKNSTSIATKACNDMLKKETLNPHTQETVKLGELVEEDIAEISRALRIYPKMTVKNLIDL